MDRFQRVEKPREETPINENEIRITTQGRIRNYMTYATTLLQEKGSDDIALKAMGRAINKTVMIAELIKRRITNLHQNTYIGSTDITDLYEPLEEGLKPVETTRHVSVITITLSKTELHKSCTGSVEYDAYGAPEVLYDCLKAYQAPIPADQVKPWNEYGYEGEGFLVCEVEDVVKEGVEVEMQVPDHGSGTASTPQSSSQGNISTGVVEYNGDGGFDGGCGYGGRGRGRGRTRGYCGRGRGYGGGNMQLEAAGYNVYNDYGGGPPAAEGRGRGCGRGRARERGRGRSFGVDGPPMQATV